MIEVLWHGRGGQGAFTAARLLGAAASLAEGRHALAFPAFGPERRGAPMRAFTKMSKAPIGDRSAIKRADYVIYLDDTLLGDGWENELKPGGIVLVNSRQSFGDERILSIDADGISSEVLGRPISNTVFLGALCSLCNQVETADVKEAIRQYMPAKLHEKNLLIVDLALEAVSAASATSAVAAASAASAASADSTALAAHAAPAASAGESADALGDAQSSKQPSSRISCETRLANAANRNGNACIPSLRKTALDPNEFAHATCFEAGHLVAKNAGWRNIRPVIDLETCTGCLQCYLYCPDGTIFKLAPNDPSAAQAATRTAAQASPDASGGKPKTLVAIDYDFCKGCGVCARMCAAGAISMISEKEALAEIAAHEQGSEANAR